MEQKNAVSYVTRKDMMARTNGPQMRISAMKISRREEEADEIIALAIPLAKA